jgi:hypothetical protein
LTVRLLQPKVETFLLHRELLEHHSGYFRTLLRLPQERGDLIETSKVNSELFEDFRSWLYSQRISDKDEAKWSEWVKLFCFAEEIESVGFMNAMLDHLVANIDKAVRLSNTDGDLAVALDHLYRYSKPSCPLRKLLLEAVYYKGVFHGARGKEFYANLPPLFLKELAGMHNNITVGQTFLSAMAPWKKGATEYHVKDKTWVAAKAAEPASSIP